MGTFDMCRNSQLNFKIRVRGEPSPLKLRLEYYDTSLKEVLQPPQLLQLKGFVDIFVSKSTDNPQHVQAQIAEAQNNCEKYFLNCQPPQ